MVAAVETIITKKYLIKKISPDNFGEIFHIRDGNYDYTELYDSLIFHYQLFIINYYCTITTTFGSLPISWRQISQAFRST